MAHGIKKMDHNHNYFTGIRGSNHLEYFCEYWGLGEGSQQLQCNLDGKEDSCDNCSYLTIRAVQQQVQPTTNPIQEHTLYFCRVLSQPVRDPASRCGLPMSSVIYCHQCKYLDISKIKKEGIIEDSKQVQVTQPEPDFYMSNPDFLEI